MPYTSNKKYSVQSATANTGVWGAGGATGDDLNTGVMGLLDTQLAGVASFSVSSSNVSLSYNNIQSCMFRFTGALLANIVASPAVGDAATYFNGFYYFENLTSGSFTITLTTGAGSVVLPQSRRGVVFVDSTNGPRIISSFSSSGTDPVPLGSVLLFYQNAAPDGYTIVSSLNDYGVKIVSSAGGVTSGSVAYSTVFGQTSTDDHTLTIAEMPLHGHPMAVCTTAGGSINATGGMALSLIGSTTFGPYTGTVSTTAGRQVGGQGGGDPHAHDIELRVKTAAVILAAKAA